MQNITTKKSLRAVFFITTIVLIIAVCLFSCTAGSKKILEKDELRDKIGTEGRNLTSVWQYLDAWDFPQFDRTKFKTIENAFAEYYYLDLPDVKEHAVACANYFLDTYYDKTELSNVDAVTDALIKSYVYAVGDKFSRYMTGDEYTTHQNDMGGAFVGIGVTVTKEDGHLFVNSVIEDGGAYDAGIKAYDKIIAVDGALISDIGTDAAINRISGEAGTTVTVTVERGESTFDVTITRKLIVDKSVKYTIEDGIAYVKITAFKSNTDEQFKEAIDFILASDASGIVYDLRDNTGGTLDSVVNMLDYVTEDGVTIASFSNYVAAPMVADDGHSFSLPTVVITNGRTASAAELFTAGLRDFSDMGQFECVTVGTVTYGKGVMQRTYSLRDGSAITITIAYYNPPSGVNYHGVGIIPDYPVELGESDTQLEEALVRINEIINSQEIN